MCMLFLKGTKMSKEQKINEPLKMMVCLVVIIIDCLSTGITREHNLLFSYRTETTNQDLLMMVSVFYIITFLNSLTRMMDFIRR